MNWYERCEARIQKWARPVLVDSFFFALFGGASIASTLSEPVTPGLHEPRLIDLVIALLTAVPILFRRRWPLGALLVSCAFTILLIGTNAPEGSVAFTIGFLVYTVAARSQLRLAVVGLGSVVATLAILGALDSPGLDALGVARFSAFFAIVWAGGVAVRARREALEASLREANERAEAAAQRSLRSVAEERLRIAQELHDVVAHSISVIAVQAGAGTHFLETKPDETRAALEAITRTSRSTLSELRSLLGVLRGDDGARSHAPAPTLADLPSLVDEMHRLGLPIRLDVLGEADTERLGIEMSAYRIIQEALTNVIKHAGPTTEVTVTVEHAPSALEVRIDDDGRGAAVAAAFASLPSGHHGLLGMRERVEVWGGHMSSGSRPGGGYSVRATFPFEPTS